MILKEDFLGSIIHYVGFCNANSFVDLRRGGLLNGSRFPGLVSADNPFVHEQSQQLPHKDPH